MARALSDIASVIGVDPTLPRDGTDFMTPRVVMRTIHPALPRIGTDFMTLRVVMRQLLRRGGSTSSLDKWRVVCSVTGAGKKEERAGRSAGDEAKLPAGPAKRSCFCFLDRRSFC